MTPRVESPKIKIKPEYCLEVSDGVDEAGVSLPDDVVERVLGLVGLQPVGRVKVTLGRGPLQLFEEHLEVSELPNDGLVQQEPDVFLVVERLDPGHVALLGTLPVPRLAGVDPFQNAEPAKVLLLRKRN